MNKIFKKLFLLDNNVTYLNHGSFGACPKVTMGQYFKIQKNLEKQPIDFLANNIDYFGPNARFGNYFHKPDDYANIPDSHYDFVIVEIF